MSISITAQPTSNGKYSAYLPIKFTATETANPEFLYFKIRKSDGTPIPEIPFYKAYNISNEFHFDAAAYLKAIFDVRSEQGLSTTAIEELTDSYGKFEVVVNTTGILTGGLISNHFFAFATLETRKETAEQTASYGVDNKELLYSNDFNAADLMPSKDRATQDRVNLFVEHDYIFVNIYLEAKPNINSVPLDYLYLDVSAYTDKLISIPLNKNFFASDFAKIGGGTFLRKHFSFKLSIGGNIPAPTFYSNTEAQHIFYNQNTECNQLEFVYINKYGVKENITFNATEDESLKTKSKQFLAHGYNAEGNTLTFNTSADRQKISQQTTITKKVEGKKMLIKRIESVKDFLTSPVVWHVGDELKQVVLYDGKYKLTKENKGLEVSFKYSSSQVKPSFL